jgi:inhibitor of KinA sporulation pathway (predicted exonuclease)
MAKRLDQILVIDVESTCWDDEPPEGQISEIIEIGLCTVDVATLKRIEKRSILVKPERSVISDYCTELTTLTPEIFTEAGTFSEAIHILKKEYHSKNRLWASWGDYDRIQFERNCRTYDVAYPFGRRHLNVKTLFALACDLDYEVDLDGAYAMLGIPMEGTHHRGDDDAWNIAGILCMLLKQIQMGITYG